MRLDTVKLLLAAALGAGATALVMAPLPEPQRCPEVTRVVTYLPQPEPAPLWPPSSLPAFENAPAVGSKAASVPVAEEAPAEDPVAEDSTESRRHHYRRHYRWRRHR